MSKEKKFYHLSVLESKKLNNSAPEHRHIGVGPQRALKEAIKEGKNWAELYPQTKGLMFIEEEGVQATTKLNCEFCDKRKTRYDFNSEINNLSDK